MGAIFVAIFLFAMAVYANPVKIGVNKGDDRGKIIRSICMQSRFYAPNENLRRNRTNMFILPNFSTRSTMCHILSVWICCHWHRYTQLLCVFTTQRIKLYYCNGYNVQ